MNKIGALEILMPMIKLSNLWKETERWNMFGRRAASHFISALSRPSGGLMYVGYGVIVDYQGQGSSTSNKH